MTLAHKHEASGEQTGVPGARLDPLSGMRSPDACKPRLGYPGHGVGTAGRRRPRQAQRARRQPGPHGCPHLTLARRGARRRRQPVEPGPRPRQRSRPICRSAATVLETDRDRGTARQAPAESERRVASARATADREIGLHAATDGNRYVDRDPRSSASRIHVDLMVKHQISERLRREGDVPDGSHASVRADSTRCQTRCCRRDPERLHPTPAR